MRLTYKYRLLPTSAQRTSLEKTLEVCRWVYNQSLSMRKDAWEQEQRRVSYYDTKKMIPIWKVDKPELTSVHSQVLQNVTERVELAFQSFFRRVKAGDDKPGYPRFRGKGWYDSFTYTQSGFKLEGDHLLLSKIGNIKVKLHRPVCGTIKTMTIGRDGLGNWSVCFSCECDIQPLPPVGKVIGVDLGLTTFAHLSDGKKIPRQRWMKIDADDIARLQRKREKLSKDSPEWHKVTRAIRHAYRRSANRRNNFAHQESRKLVNEYQFIAFEKLGIRDMQVNGNKTINRGIMDVAWGQFVQFTSYKAANAGRLVVLVDPRYTTQMCSRCNAIVPKILSARIHNCPYCGLRLNRDHNAALNILARGLSSIGTDSSVVAVEAHGL